MISTEVIDTVRGAAAEGVPVQLDYFITGHGWRQVGQSFTNAEGAVPGFAEPPAPGVYRLVYDIAAYRADAFFPSIAVTFEVNEPARSHHLPLTLSPFGYSVFRAA